MNWTIRATDPVTAIPDLDLKITAYELQSSEKMADAVKRGVLLGLTPDAEVQKHVMKDSVRWSTYERMFFVRKLRFVYPRMLTEPA